MRLAKSDGTKTQRTRSRHPAYRNNIVLRADPKQSGRYSQCIPIGSHRHSRVLSTKKPSYRVRPNILDEWGGLSVSDGYIERSATLPSFIEPKKFLQWLEEQRPSLVHSNFDG